MPLRGTAWMTPPSYFQSQREYNQPVNPSGPSDATYVPPYSETAQPYDAGYYDKDGVFHRNELADEHAVIPDSTGLSKPETTHFSPRAANFEQDFGTFYGTAGTTNSNDIVREASQGSSPGTSQQQQQTPQQGNTTFASSSGDLLPAPKAHTAN